MPLPPLSRIHSTVFTERVSLPGRWIAWTYETATGMSRMTIAMATPRRIHFDRLERGGFLPAVFAAACSCSRCSRISRRDFRTSGSVAAPSRANRSRSRTRPTRRASRADRRADRRRDRGRDRRHLGVALVQRDRGVAVERIEALIPVERARGSVLVRELVPLALAVRRFGRAVGQEILRVGVALPASATRVPSEISGRRAARRIAPGLNRSVQLQVGVPGLTGADRRGRERRRRPPGPVRRRARAIPRRSRCRRRRSPGG